VLKVSPTVLSYETMGRNHTSLQISLLVLRVPPIVPSIRDKGIEHTL